MLRSDAKSWRLRKHASPRQPGCVSANKAPTGAAEETSPEETWQDLKLSVDCRERTDTARDGAGIRGVWCRDLAAKPRSAPLVEGAGNQSQGPLRDIEICKRRRLTQFQHHGNRPHKSASGPMAGPPASAAA
jgi:hypothetical protein